MGCIYKATDMTNGKIYIGQTCDFKARIRYYRSDAKHFKDLSRHRLFRPIDVAMGEHGFENFKFEIIEDNVPPEDIDMAEIGWIRHYNSANPEVGYNRDLGGFGKPSKEKLEAFFGVKKDFARKHTEEEKLRRSKGIVVYDPIEDTISFKTSAKEYSDELGNTRSEVSMAIRRGSKIRGMYVFYLDDYDRGMIFLDIYDKKMATKNTQAIMSLIEYAKAFERVDVLLTKLNNLSSPTFNHTKITNNFLSDISKPRL